MSGIAVQEKGKLTLGVDLVDLTEQPECRPFIRLCRRSLERRFHCLTPADDEIPEGPRGVFYARLDIVDWKEKLAR